MRLPVREGYGPAERVERGMRDHRLKISTSATLRDLARDYAVFNHGAFFTHGKLDVDPVADYVAKHPDPDVLAMPSTFPQRIWGGLDAPGRRVGPAFDWNRTLVFVEHRFWAGLFDHLRCCGWVDRRRRFYARATVQVIPVVDFLAVGRALVVPVPPPVAEVVAFGVDGTHAHVQFVPRFARPDDVPVLTHLPVQEGTRALGAALLSQDPRPFRFVESEDPFAGHQGVIPPAP